MHVCDVDNFYSPRGGGVKTYHDQKLHFFLQNPEHEYTLVYASEETSRRDLSPRVRVVTVPGVRMGDDYRFMLNAIRLRRLLDVFRPDVVELGEPYFLPWVMRVASAGRSWPLVGYWHADFPRVYVERPISRFSPWAARRCSSVAWWYARRTYGPLAAVFASSAPMIQSLRANGLLRVFETPLAVDTALFNPAKRDPDLRRSLGAGTGTVLFMFPHRLSGEKGLAVALEAFSRVSSRHDVGLIVAGSGPGDELVRDHARRNPFVHHLGYVHDRELLARWYASADVVLSLCPFETFGLATVEAVASGCAVVGTSRGPVGDLLARSGAGVRLGGDDPEAIAEVLLGLLRHPERLAELRARGPLYVEREYSWTATFSHLLHCYERVIAAS